jgi:hypothetical protein
VNVLALKEFAAFIVCTYATKGAQVTGLVNAFVTELQRLIEQIELVRVEKRRAVSSRALARVGACAPMLRRHLRGIQNVSDCRDDWSRFGLVYHAIFPDQEYGNIWGVAKHREVN